MNAYDIEIVNDAAHAGEANHGWCFGLPPGIRPEQWPLDPDTGYPLMHGFTLLLPEDYRVHGPEIVALSFFSLAPDQNDGGPTSVDGIREMLIDPPAQPPADAELRPFWEAGRNSHPRLHRMEDILGGAYAACPPGRRGGRAMNAVCESIDASLDARDRPLLSVRGLTRLYGPEKGCQEVDFDLYPGEVLGIVGESGSGKSTLLSLLSGRLPPDAGTVAYRDDGDRWLDLYAASEAERRTLLRTEWGFVGAEPARRPAHGRVRRRQHRRTADGPGRAPLRSAAQAGLDWLEQVEIDPLRIDDLPRTFSGGMQQRLQIARNLVSAPRLVFMDEPTGGLDVSVQARLLDLLRGLVRELDLAVVIVTHDLAVARLLADRLMVMRRSRVVEAGLTDQILDDPQHPYTQLLVSSVLQP